MTVLNHLGVFLIILLTVNIRMIYKDYFVEDSSIKDFAINLAYNAFSSLIFFTIFELFYWIIVICF